MSGHDDVSTSTGGAEGLAQFTLQSEMLQAIIRRKRAAFAKQHELSEHTPMSLQIAYSSYPVYIYTRES